MGRELSGECRTENHPEKLRKYVKGNNYAQQEKIIKEKAGVNYIYIHTYKHTVKHTNICTSQLHPRVFGRCFWEYTSMSAMLLLQTARSGVSFWGAFVFDILLLDSFSFSTPTLIVLRHFAPVLAEISVYIQLHQRTTRMTMTSCFWKKFFWISFIGAAPFLIHKTSVSCWKQIFFVVILPLTRLWIFRKSVRS